MDTLPMLISYKLTVGPLLIERDEYGFFILAWYGRFELFTGLDGKLKLTTPAREAREAAEMAEGDARYEAERSAVQAEWERERVTPQGAVLAV